MAKSVAKKGDLLGTLESGAEPPGDGFMSRREWRNHLGVSDDRIGNIFADMHSRGCLESKQAEVRDLSGRRNFIPVYRIDIDKLRKSRGKK